MAIDRDKILNWPFKKVEQTYTAKDTILYALGLGLGADPLDEHQLDFVFEENDFKALPTMAAVLAGPGFWVREPESGIDWAKILHGEQGLRIHKPLAPEATVMATTKVTGLIDKGADKGALIYLERTLVDKETGEELATLTSTSFGRGDGGFGGPTGPVPGASPAAHPGVVRRRSWVPAGLGCPAKLERAIPPQTIHRRVAGECSKIWRHY